MTPLDLGQYAVGSAPAGPVEYVVAAAVLVAAGAALFGRPQLTGIISFVVFGALLAVWWGLIGAPDVALAEAAIGTGVTAAMFLHAATLRGRATSAHTSPAPDTGATGARTGRGGVARGGAVLSAVAGLGLGGVLGLALTRAGAATGDPGAPGLGPTAQDHLADTGVEHPITAVLLNFRSLDTLMEIVVLLVAASIALAFLPQHTTPHPDDDSHLPQAQPTRPGAGATTLVRHYARLSAPLLVALAAWLLFAGSSRPGGAFQSGAVLAAALIGLHIAEVQRLGTTVALRVVLVIGLVAFLGVAAGTWAATGTWLELRGSAAGPVTIVLEGVLAATIGASLAVIYLAAARRQP